MLYQGAKYQNLWEKMKDAIWQKDNNIEFFLHGKALCDVIKQKHRIREATVWRYATFINFQVGFHNIILEPKEDPTKQAHPTGFMIKNVNVDVIIQD